MKTNKNLHLNRSNRKVHYDYSTPGVYFITSDIQNPEKILGKIENAEIILTEYGEIVKNELIKLPEYHKRIILDEWVIIPKHIHIIIILRNYGLDNGISLNGANINSQNNWEIQNVNIKTNKYCQKYTWQ
ncbi:MAG: hypothetical protein PHW82_16635 [Bacteroidales bacterium]|nr:hypothetical protein [Bacteroidales bacterium]